MVSQMEREIVFDMLINVDSSRRKEMVLATCAKSFPRTKVAMLFFLTPGNACELYTGVVKVLGTFERTD